MFLCVIGTFLFICVCIVCMRAIGMFCLCEVERVSLVCLLVCVPGREVCEVLCVVLYFPTEAVTAHFMCYS